MLPSGVRRQTTMVLDSVPLTVWEVPQPISVVDDHMSWAVQRSSAGAVKRMYKMEEFTPMGPGLDTIADDSASRVVSTAGEPLLGGRSESVEVGVRGGEVGKDLALVGALGLGGVNDLAGGLEVSSPVGGLLGEGVVPGEGGKGMGSTLLVDESHGVLGVRGNGDSLGGLELADNGGDKDGSEGGRTHLERCRSGV